MGQCVVDRIRRWVVSPRSRNVLSLDPHVNYLIPQMGEKVATRIMRLPVVDAGEFVPFWQCKRRCIDRCHDIRKRSGKIDRDICRPQQCIRLPFIRECQRLRMVSANIVELLRSVFRSTRDDATAVRLLFTAGT